MHILNTNTKTYSALYTSTCFLFLLLFISSSFISSNPLSDQNNSQQPPLKARRFLSVCFLLAGSNAVHQHVKQVHKRTQEQTDERKNGI